MTYTLIKCAEIHIACSSAQDLLQAAGYDGLANQLLVPPSGSIPFMRPIPRGSHKADGRVILQTVQDSAKKVGLALPRYRGLIAIDGSFLDACRPSSVASSNARPIVVPSDSKTEPCKIFLSDGRPPKDPVVSLALGKDQTGVMDRGYQEHARFDAWINDEKHFEEKCERLAHQKEPIN